jgi:NAD(P)-dependent dehydrogenase (short-subunit alcohol dehydrogenase family)
LSDENGRAVYPSLRGKRVLVTGGGSGIGAGIVEAFVRQGSEVTFFDICDGYSEALAAKTGAKFERVDLTDIPATQATIRMAAEERGPFEVLVNNAANDDRHSIEEVTEAYWDNRLNVNLKHHFFCAQAVIPAMKENGRGAIINLGSISWHLALPDLVLYQTAKAAIEGMTRAMARDLGPDNIRVSCVVPGNVRTPRQLKWYTPEGEAGIVNAQCLKGRLVPEDVAALILFLASDDARLVTGHEHFVDAGWR